MPIAYRVLVFTFILIFKAWDYNIDAFIFKTAFLLLSISYLLLFLLYLIVILQVDFLEPIFQIF